MTEANNINTDFDSKSNLGAIPLANNDQVDCENGATATSRRFSTEKNYFSVDSLPDSVGTQPDNTKNTEHQESLAHTMNWQKVAHKLREYNRKLLKKVFRLEQEIAEIDNKFNKHLEKSKNSDLLVANQAEEIKGCQEKIALLSQKLTSSEQQTSNQETIISNLSQQYNLSQKQAAQLERECTLLQEKYDYKTYELDAKEQETKELKIKLSQQQQCALQYKADLQRYLDKTEAFSTAKVISRKENLSNNLPNNRSIKPWSEVLSHKTEQRPPRRRQVQGNGLRYRASSDFANFYYSRAKNFFTSNQTSTSPSKSGSSSCCGNRKNRS